MLTLIAGRGKSGKTRMLLNMVRRCPSTAMASRIILVPEQLSHQTERLLSALAGDGISYVSEVLSFTRLFSRVTSICGGIGPTLDQGGRLLSARLALDTVRPQLRVFSAAAGRAEFLSNMLGMIDELKAYEITPALLQDTAKQTEGVFSQKLHELSLILSAYEAVTAQGAADPRDKLTLLKKKLLEGEYGAGRHFFVDGFTDFSRQELGVLGALLRTGESMTITVPCGDPEEPEDIFAPGLETLSQLKALGEAMGQEVQLLRADHQRELPKALTYLDRLFSYGALPYEGVNTAVNVLTCADQLEECRSCGAILKRHAMEGIRYRDMAVAVSDEKRYGPMLRAVFSAMDIPIYFSEKRQVLAHPAVRAVLLALTCAVGGMETEDVSAYLKTGLTGLAGCQIDALENYAYTWAIRGKKWEREWTMHPEGYDGRFTQETELLLRELNQTKQEALGPIFRLSAGLKEAQDVSGQLTALYDYFQNAKLYEHLERQVSAMTEAGQLESAQETAQIWSILLSLLQQVYSVLGRLSMDPQELLRVLNLALSEYQVGTIPASLDSVSFGSISAVRGLEPKILCVLGAGDGLLPGAAVGGSLLTESERTILREQFSIPLAPDMEGTIQRELLTIYSAFTAPTEKLYVSYPESLGGEALEPSFLVSRLRALLPEADAQAPMDTIYTPETAAEQYLSTEDPALRTLMRRAAEQIPSLEQAISSGLSGARPRDTQVAPETAKRLFGTPVPLTASRLDKLGTCPLDFFLYYGLKARPRKEAAFDAAEFGTFVHFILEHTVPSVVGESPLDDQGSMALVDRHMPEYEAERLSTLQQTNRQKYLLSRNRQEAALLVREISGELSLSDFVPCAYELSFGGGDGLPALTAEGKLGQGRLSGFVDRVDLWNGPEGDFLRVIDYKTGTKAFDYTDLYGGVGMQMLLYLFALEQSGLPGKSQRPISAGVLYFPARRGYASQEDPENREPAPTRRSGLVLEEEPVLQAMEHGETFQYLPVKRTKSGALGDYAVSRDQLKLLKAYVETRMAQATDQILGGRFAPKPFYRGASHDPCGYCDFAEVCQKDRQFRKTCYQEPVSPEAFWNMLREGGDQNG